MARPRTNRIDNADEWFTPRVDTSGGPDACWPGPTTVSLSGRPVRGYLVAYTLAQGGPPPSGRAHHICPGSVMENCCNPAHLADGPPPQRRDRQPGALSAADVEAIIASGDGATALARRFGVTRQTIHRLRTGRKPGTDDSPGSASSQAPAAPGDSGGRGQSPSEAPSPPTNPEQGRRSEKSRA